MEKPKQRLILGAVATAEFLTTFMASSIFVASRILVDDLDASTVALSWISLGYILAVAAFLMPAGKLAGSLGRKRVFLIGMAVFTVFALSSAFAPSPAVLIVLRLLAGVGAAMIFACTTALATLAYPPEARGRALGIQVSGTYLGLTLGPLFGGLIIEHLGWRWVFAITGILGVIVCAVAWQGMRGTEWREEARDRFDILGSLLWAAALVVLLIGMSLLPGGLGVGLFMGGLLGLVAFVWWETRARDPILDLALFRDSRVFAFSNAAVFANYAATFAAPFLLTLFLEYNLGLSERMSGLLLVAGPAVQTMVSPLAGRLADRMQARLLAAGGMTVCTVGLVLLALIDAETSKVYVVLVFALLGLGFAFFSSPIMHSIMGSVPSTYSSVASATIASIRTAGQNVSMGIVTVVMAVIVGRHSIDASSATDLDNLLVSGRVSFSILAGLCVLGVAASLAGPKKVGGS